MKAGLSAAFGNAAPRRDPTTGEISGGFPCGPLDIELFDELFYRSTQIGIELDTLLGDVGITPSDGSTSQVSAAVRGTFSFGSAGWQKLPSGLIIQWGTATVGASGNVSSSATVAWPTTFPTACRAALASAALGANSVAGCLPSCGFTSILATSGNLVADTLTGGSSTPVYFNQAVPVRWFALGN